MKRYALAFCLTVGAVLPYPTLAQNMLEAKVSGQPLIYMKDGTLRGCGLRIFSVYVANDLSTVAIDTSVNIYTNKMFAFKGEVSEFAAPKQGRMSTPRAIEIESVWIKPPQVDATRPLAEVMKGDNNRSLLYLIPLDSALAVILSAAKGQSISMGFRKVGSSACLLWSPHPDRKRAITGSGVHLRASGQNRKIILRRLT